MRELGNAAYQFCLQVGVGRASWAEIFGDVVQDCSSSGVDGSKKSGEVKDAVIWDNPTPITHSCHCRRHRRLVQQAYAAARINPRFCTTKLHRNNKAPTVSLSSQTFSEGNKPIELPPPLQPMLNPPHHHTPPSPNPSPKPLPPSQECPPPPPCPTADSSSSSSPPPASSPSP